MKSPRFIFVAVLAVAAAAALGGCGKTGTPTSAIPALDSSPPQPPSGGRVASDPATGSDVLQWTPNSEPDLAKYQVYLYAPSPQRENAYIPVAEVAGGNSMRLPAVDFVTTLYYRVRAVDASGNRSAASPLIAAEIVPTTPTIEPPSEELPPILRH